LINNIIKIKKFLLRRYLQYRRTILSTVIILFTFFSLFYFFDIYLNAAIAEWFTHRFLTQEIVDASLVNKEVMNNIFNWGLFKQYCIGAALIVICLLVIGSQLLTIRRVKRASMRERKRIEEIVERMIAGDVLEMFPDDYSSIIRKIELLLKEQEKNNSEKNKENERINDMITYLAHDLRTPLTSIIGYLTLFLNVPELPDEIKYDYIKKTLDKAKHLESLIRDFFEITKYNSQKMSLNKQQINLHYMFVQLVDEFFPVLESKNLKIEVDVEKELVINVDSEKMGRVFSNLLKNACNYSFEYTTLRISAEAKTDSIEILFVNKGEPISENQQEQIFRNFVRLDESRNSDSGGSGLGLAIVKAIVNQHEGEIIAYTEAGNNIFKITLPNAM